MAPPARTEPLPVCVDSDVLIAGLISRRGASHAILILGEVGLFTLIVPQAAVDEVRRNLRRLLPDALPLFEQFLTCPAVRICAGSARDEAAANGHADAKDVPILAAAIAAGARQLVIHNVRHFRPSGGIRVVRPSVLLEEARAWIADRGK